MFLLDWILGLFKTDKPGEVVEWGNQISKIS